MNRCRQLAPARTYGGFNTWDEQRAAALQNQHYQERQQDLFHQPISHPPVFTRQVPSAVSTLLLAEGIDCK